MKKNTIYCCYYSEFFEDVKFIGFEHVLGYLIINVTA